MPVQFRISVSGDWCNGYRWAITRTDTNRVIRENGPYHGPGNPRGDAWDDAVMYADRFDLSVPDTRNPYR